MHKEMSKRKRSEGVDFTDAGECMELTRGTLATMGIALELPADSLCPPVPNRLNYIDWLNSLLPQLVDSSSSSTPTNPHILDIGTGSSCIYPLLGRQKYHWRFTGCDIDAKALEWAEKNAALNVASAPSSGTGTGNREQAQGALPTIALVLVPTGSDKLQSIFTRFREEKTSDEPRRENVRTKVAKLATSKIASLLLSLDWCDTSLRGPIRHTLAAMGTPYSQVVVKCEYQQEQHGLVLTAVMSNPPFYDLHEEISPNPRTVCTGSDVEMRTVGGEVCFVLSFIADSLALKGCIGWYTCLLGKKSSLRVLVPVLKLVGVKVVRTTRLEQGRTHRWAIAWSYRSEIAESLGREGSTNPTPFRMPSTDLEASGVGSGPNRVVARRVPLELQSPSLSADVAIERLAQSLQAQGLPAEGSSASFIRLRFEVEVSSSTGEAAIVASCCLGASVNLKELDAICGRLKVDIERTSRKWRRQCAETVNKC